MKINYDIERISTLLKDLHAISGLTLSFWNNHFEMLVAQPMPQNPFCEAIRQTEEGFARCRRSDIRLLSECVKLRSSTTCICHAGLPDTAVPLFFKENLLGVIMFGQATDRNNEPLTVEEIEKRLKGLPIDIEAQKKAYESLVCYDKHRIRATASIASVCLQHILLEKMIRLEENDLSEKITAFIEQNLSTDLSFQKIMDAFHLSKTTLYDFFHERFGCTVHSYIQKVRLNRAAVLLADSGLAIALIAMQVGFSDQNYFTRLFKKEYGIAPLTYRKLHLKTK